MTNEFLEANLDGALRGLRLKNYLVQITVDVPYPRTFEYRESASGVAPAVSRAIKKMRKDVHRKRVREIRIKAIQL